MRSTSTWRGRTAPFLWLQSRQVRSGTGVVGPVSKRSARTVLPRKAGLGVLLLAQPQSNMTKYSRSAGLSRRPPLPPHSASCGESEPFVMHGAAPVRTTLFSVHGRGEPTSKYRIYPCKTRTCVFLTTTRRPLEVEDVGVHNNHRRTYV